MAKILVRCPDFDVENHKMRKSSKGEERRKYEFLLPLILHFIDVLILITFNVQF